MQNLTGQKNHQTHGPQLHSDEQGSPEDDLEPGVIL
jgi:hypothetical protein